MTGSPFQGVSVPTSAYPDDDGSADAAVAQALAAYAIGNATEYDVAGTLVGTRALVPVVAVLDEVGEHGADKASHMASVTLTTADGRRGLVAFTSLHLLQQWNPDARPVAVPMEQAAVAALDDADGLLLDISGPVPYAVDGAALRALAAGRRHVPSYADPDVIAVVKAAAEVADDVLDVDCAAGDSGELLVIVTANPGAEPAAVVEVVTALATRLASDLVIRDRCERGVSVAVAAP